MTQIDDPLIAGMHLVIDPDKNRPLVPEIGHSDPDMHRQRIAGGRQAVLRKDLVGIRPATLEFVAVVTGSAILYLDMAFPDGRGFAWRGLTGGL